MTLDNHYFPAVDEDDPINHNEVVKPVDVPKTYNAETQITRHVRYGTLDIIRIESFAEYFVSYLFYFYTENKHPLMLSTCLCRPLRKFSTYVVK